MVCLLWVQLLYKFPDLTSDQMTASPHPPSKPFYLEILESSPRGSFPFLILSHLIHQPIWSALLAKPMPNHPLSFSPPPPLQLTPSGHFCLVSSLRLASPPHFCPLQCILRKADTAMFRK